MSSKARTVEHGGVDWKVIPGSRREQLLMRMIRQDNALHHADVEPGDDLDRLAYSIAWAVLGLAVGIGGTVGVWWLI